MQNACINAYLIDTWIGMICDMGETPYLLVAVDQTNRDIRLPEEFIREDRAIVLNVDPPAIRDFRIDKEAGIISFNARFRGKPEHVVVPCEAVHQVYSKEGNFATMVSGDLMFYHADEPAVEPAVRAFEEQPDSGAPVGGGSDGPRPDAPKPSESGKRPHLRVVK